MDYGTTEYSRKKVGNWDKFCLLMWKNGLLIWRQKVAASIEILVPVFFTALLVLIRGLALPETYEEPFTYTSFAPIDTSAWTWGAVEYTLAYAPANPQLLPLMAKARELMNMDLEFIPFNTVAELEDRMIGSQSRLLFAGVVFNNLAINDPTLPTHLNVSIRFPAESRAVANPNALSNNWQTDSLFPLFSEGGPRNREERFGGTPPGYHEERFLSVQSAISQAFIELNLPAAEPGPLNILRNLKINRFWYPPTTVDGLITIMQMFVGLIIFISFIYPAINNVKMISLEKERQLKEAMKIMGLPSWIHWTAWFVKMTIFQVITITLMVILLNVRWFPDTDVSVLTHSDATALWVFLFSYTLSFTTFCFMMSVLFSKANTAATITGLVWFLFSVPYSFTQSNYENLSLATKMLLCLFHNSGISYGFLLIFGHEANSEGLQWSNFFTPTTIDDDFSVGHVTVMLIVAALLYLLIALYVEQIFPGDFGVPRKWYFPIEGLLRLNKQYGDDGAARENCNQEHFETDPHGKTAGIETRGLRKMYTNDKVAVLGLSMNMYKDEITVLLGDNGAGKTTTMSMLSGMFAPTSGTATINGCDVRTNIDGVRESIGLCPQHNVLFDELTVREHIIFFSKLKGLSNEDADSEVNKYVELLELVPKTNSQSNTLSGGMKRKLSVGVALCGGSRVVLCDEPTSGMDPAARRALWDLLQLEKRGRTILLSTHFMDEADVLGDRIAIMHQGELKCYGSSFFLKKAFGTGYELVCEKGLHCDVNATTKLIQEYIPETRVDSNVGTELSFKLDGRFSRVFQSLLGSLEDNSERLDIHGYGISQTTLEEVFLKVTSGMHLMKPSAQSDQEASGKPETNQHGEFEQLLGGNFLWSQIRAMFLKKTLYTWRNRVLFLIQILVPVTMVAITILIGRTFSVGGQLRALPITMDMYTNNPVALLASEVTDAQSTGAAILRNYQRMFEDPPTERHLQELPQGTSITDHILGLTNQELVSFNARTLVGLSVQNEEVVAWFNNQPYHTIPLAMNLAYNALLKTSCADCSISITNHPLPFRVESRQEMVQAGNNMGFLLASNIGDSMAFVAAFYIIFYIKERVSRSKLMQFVSGVNIWTFWFTAYVWDLVTFLITTGVMVASLAVFQEDGWSTGDELGRVYLMTVFFVWAVLPLVYLFSMLFQIPSDGFIKALLLGIFLGVVVFYTVYALNLLGSDNISEAITWAFMIVPFFALTSALGRFNDMNTVVSACNTICDASAACNSISDLCNAEGLDELCCVTDYFAWENPGVLRNVIFMIISGVLFMAILFMVEFRMFHRMLYKCKRSPAQALSPTTGLDGAAVDSDVMEEKNRIKNMNYNEIRANNLVVRNMTKFYGKFRAVNDICVGVDAGDCFGLLGVNGAGKTSTFKMLTGDETISSGEAWIRGQSLKTEMEEIYKSIGYCPQFDALLEDLTGRETLKIFALLRGIHPDQIERLTLKLATEFNYTQHIDKKVKEYSGGNKRKLSTSLALLGNPSVVYLDEPTTGMDPGAKRLLWEVMSRYKATGKSIILTSHSMEECEALCTRLTIMVNGEFKCLGSTQHLKNKFSKGYLLIIQMNRKFNGPEGQLKDPKEEMAPVKRFVDTNLHRTVLKEEYQGRMTYYIPTTNMKWSTMFGIMETAKEQFNIESYSLSQTSLEQVFLSFTKYQREEGSRK